MADRARCDADSARHRAVSDGDVAAEAKRLMRGVLDHYLDERRIFSRRVVQDLAALEDDR